VVRVLRCARSRRELEGINIFLVFVQLSFSLIMFGVVAKYNPIAGSAMQFVVLAIHLVAVGVLRPFPSLYKNIAFCVMLVAGLFSCLGRIVVVAGNTTDGQGLAYMEMALLIVFFLLWAGLIFWSVINYGSGSDASQSTSGQGKPVKHVATPTKEHIVDGDASVSVHVHPGPATLAYTTDADAAADPAGVELSEVTPSAVSPL